MTESLLDRSVIADDRVQTVIPYVGFFSTKSPKAGEVKSGLPDIAEGDAYLRWPEGYLRKLSPFVAYLVDGIRYYADIDSDNGQILKGSFNQPLNEKGLPDYKSPLKEHVDAALIVLTPDRLVPARCIFRPTKTPAANKMIKASRDAKTSDWATFSELHAQSMVGFGREVTWARFLAVISSIRQVSKFGKGAGKPYFKADAVIVPSTADQQAKLAEMLNTKKDDYNALVSWFDSRVAFLKGVVKE